jgi:hypothetical protein
MKETNKFIKLIESGMQWKGVFRLLPALSLLVLCFWLAGCSSNTTSSSRLPSTTTVASKNTYVGSQDPGIFTMTLDNSADTFAYQQTTNYALTTTSQSGSTTSTSGFLDFGTSNGTSLGKAIELGGSMALLRPGAGTAYLGRYGWSTSIVLGRYLIPMVAESSCFAISNGPVRYVFLDDNTGSYGTFVVSTDSTGTNWYFTDVVDSSGNALLGPEEFNATCAESNGAAVVTAESDLTYTSLNVGENDVPAFYFHPNGGMFMTRNPSALTINGNKAVYETWVGFAAPTSAPTASQLTSTSYRGFMLEKIYFVDSSGYTDQEYLSYPVLFTPGGSNTLVGGPYPNDDLTQTPSTTQYTLSPGSANTAVNGTFTSATLTTLDPQQACGASIAQGTTNLTDGYNSAGAAICTGTGTMTASQVDGKNVLFVQNYDATYSDGGTDVPSVTFYLFAE